MCLNCNRDFIFFANCHLRARDQSSLSPSDPLTRAYSKVQPDTKCVVGKDFCAVKNQKLCSYFFET